VYCNPVMLVLVGCVYADADADVKGFVALECAKKSGCGSEDLMEL
jgi:hypothetical protein